MSHLSVRPGLSTSAEATLLTALYNMADSGAAQAIRKSGGAFYNVDLSGTVTVGTTVIASGTTTKVLYDNAGVLGEYTISGTGSVAMTASPSFTTPSLGVATATSLAIGGATIGTNGLAITGHVLIEGVTTTGATGTGLLVFGTSPTLTTAVLGSSTATTQAANDNSTKVATTAYVDTAVGSLDSKPAVAYASTSALPANDYANGTLGVGATLTGQANGPLIIDGVTILVGQAGERVLVAGESASANNGWYTITTVGVVAVSKYVLTRAVESDQAAEIGAGYLTSVTAPNTVTPGSANNGKVFISVAADPFTVGTTALTFSQVGGTYTNGTGLGLSGSTFSLIAPVTPQLGGTGVINNSASTITISGSFATTLTVTNTTGVTLPTTGTLSTLAGSEELTNKTLTSSVGKGTWTASGTWTLPAITLAGTVSGGGQQLNNIIIGTSTPLAGTFTVVTASKAGLALDVANTTDATSNQVVKVSGVNATRANNDLIYASFFLANSAGTQKEFGRMNIKAPVVTNTSEDGSFIWSVMTAGTLTDMMTMTKNSLSIGTSNTFTTGTIELGAASDTTIARVSAGLVSIEGSNIGTMSAAQVWTGQNKFNNIIDVTNNITASSNAATVPVTYRLSTVTNDSAGNMTITMTTTSAVDGQMTVVRIYDFSAVAKTVAWVNTENSTVSAPTTSNGSTTLPLTVGFQYNSATSKWRCIASA